MGWLNSSKWKLSVPCFSLYCLSTACQVFADRLALFTKTKSQKWRGWGSLVHLYGTPWAPSPTLKTQAVASSQQPLDHARSCCLPGRGQHGPLRWQSCPGGLQTHICCWKAVAVRPGLQWQSPQSSSFVSVHTFQFQMLCLFSVPIIGSGEPAPSFRVLPAQTLSLTEGESLGRL